MPQDTARACLVCHGTVVPGTSANPNYHDGCNPRPEQRREADRKRWVENPEIRRLYNMEAWKRLRLQILARDPICKICNRAPSTVADHINDHKGNTQLFFSWYNLQGLCKSCHDRKTGHTSTPNESQPKTSYQINGVSYPVAGGAIGSTADSGSANAGSSPALPTIPPSAPPLIPVKPEHMALEDGRVAIKAEYNRWYVKRGPRWFILAADFAYDRDTENGILKKM